MVESDGERMRRTPLRSLGYFDRRICCGSSVWERAPSHADAAVHLRLRKGTPINVNGDNANLRQFGPKSRVAPLRIHVLTTRYGTAQRSSLRWQQSPFGWQ